MKTILIVQSVPVWMSILISAISAKLPELADFIGGTDSFDHALDLIPLKGELIVITSDMFHDQSSQHRKSVTQKAFDSDKNSDNLAKLVKKKNKNAKVFVFSEFKPKTAEYLDGFIQKEHSNQIKNITNVLKIFE